MQLSKKLSFEEFVCFVEKTLMEHLGSEYFSQRKKVVKNNSVTLISLVIRKRDELIVPCIYLNTYFSQYEEGRQINEICDEILDVYLYSKDSERNSFDEIIFRYDEMKSSIIYRIINYEKNKELLESVPYIKVLDFAVTFHCLVRDDEEGIGTIRITEEHRKQWGVKLEELYIIAMKNTPEIFPALIRPMEEVMLELMKKEVMSFAMDDISHLGLAEEKHLEAEQAANEFIQMLHYENPKCKVDMYVLSNSRGINGASCILYPEILSDFADQIDNDFFILPSSIHELILVPVEEQLGIKQLKEMVMEINQTQVPLEDVLSDDIYCYSRSNKQMIGIA